jgi:cyclophilin family peptidyl-prolyl cis-trans isomerase
MLKRFFSILVATGLLLTLASCQVENTGNIPKSETTESEIANENLMTPEVTPFMESTAFYNFNEPKEGDEIIVMTIKNYGTVKIRLFPELVPKAVENFVTHAKEGYYDGLIFHRIIAEFMIQGGDPLGTGTGGESIWGGKFDSGMTDKLHHFTGALAYANSGSTSTSGSQFYICVNKTLTQAEIDSYVQAGYTFDEETQKKYMEVGGQPFLDGGIFGGSNAYTVFGQVYEGQNIIEAVSKVQTGTSDRPLEAVVIESIKVEEYHK